MSHRVCMRALSVALVLSVMLLGAVAAAPARAAQPGTVTDITWGTSRSDIDKTVALMQAGGVRWIRTNVPWTGIQPDDRSSYNTAYLADIDYATAKARAAGINIVMPVADGVPYWASADPEKYTDSSGNQHWNRYYRPSDNQEYANFFHFVVDRYKAQGVHAYEVWNEPNLPRFWPSGVDAASYVQMLKAAYPAIKSADPSSTVILGGLSGNDRDYLAGVYDAGGKNYFDAAGVHDYAWGDPTNCWNDASGHRAKDSFCGIEEMRRVMVDRGDAAKAIWMTEFGWSTCDNSSPNCYGSGVSQAQQADYLTKAFNLLDQRYSYVKVAMVYNFRSDYWMHDDAGDFDAQTGLMTTNFTPKPAFAAFKAYALSHAASDGPASPPPAGPSGSSAGTPTSRPSSHRPAMTRRAPLRARRTSTTMAIHHNRPVARAASLPRTPRLQPTVVSGRVANAPDGVALVRFQRYEPHSHRWTTVRVRVVRLGRSGQFSVAADYAGAHGRWRVRAEYRGSRDALPSRSCFRSLQLAAV